MKFIMAFSVGTVYYITIFLPIIPALDIPNASRDAKALNYRYNSDDLNIEHIISQWNRSVTDDSTTTVSSAPLTTTSLPTTLPKIEQKKDKLHIYTRNEKIPGNFPERFNFCVKKQKFISKSPVGHEIIVKCLKAEIITKLHKLLASPSNTIKLFNGYLEFQKVENKKKDESVSDVETKKRYSSRVSFKKPLEPEGHSSQPLIPIVLKEPTASQRHANDYYEEYQKMLRELVARKNGIDLTREKRERHFNAGTLEKSAQLFENGRKLISEISNNLENEEKDVETFTETILDPDLVSSINNFTKMYTLRLNFYPGVAARMKRNENSGVTFDLELDDLNEVEEDDNSEQDDDGGRDGKKKKKPKISKKTLKKLFPYLLIPFMIQAALLPIVLKFLLFVAIKALIAGKLALILVAFNAIRNASLKSDEDEYVEKMSFEHYGYGNGEEYGAWVNRRAINVPGEEESMDGEYADPYMGHKPDPPRK